MIKGYYGSVRILGKDLRQYSRKVLAQVVGLVPQLGQLSFEYTVEEFVLMGCAAKIGYFAMPDKNAQMYVIESLDALGIKSLKDRLMNSLSGGER